MKQDELAVHSKVQGASLSRFEAGRVRLSHAQRERIRLALVRAAERRVFALGRVHKLLIASS